MEVEPYFKMQYIYIHFKQVLNVFSGNNKYEKQSISQGSSPTQCHYFHKPFVLNRKTLKRELLSFIFELFIVKQI